MWHHRGLKRGSEGPKNAASPSALGPLSLTCTPRQHRHPHQSKSKQKMVRMGRGWELTRCIHLINPQPSKLQPHGLYQAMSSPEASHDFTAPEPSLRRHSYSSLFQIKSTRPPIQKLSNKQSCKLLWKFIGYTDSYHAYLQHMKGYKTRTITFTMLASWKMSSFFDLILRNRG